MDVITDDPLLTVRFGEPKQVLARAQGCSYMSRGTGASAAVRQLPCACSCLYKRRTEVAVSTAGATGACRQRLRMQLYPASAGQRAVAAVT